MTERDRPSFSNWLGQTRRRQAISQTDLAIQADVDCSTISKLEGGTRKPTLKVAIQLAEALGDELPIVIGQPFNIWLQTHRNAQGISMRELGRISGIAHSTVSRIERGKRLPTLETVQRLLDALR